MIGPYDSQQVLGQNTGYFGGQGFGQTAGYFGGQGAGQAASYYGGQGVGQTAGYFGGQGVGQTAGFVGGQGVDVTASYFGGQGVGQTAGFVGGQGVDVTASYFGGQAAGQGVNQTSVLHRSAEFAHGKHQGSSAAGERQQRQHSGTSTSSSSTGGDNKAAVNVSSTQVGAAVQQHSVGSSSHVVEGAAGASFDVSGASFGSTVGGQRRQARVRKEVIRLPDQPQGPARQVRHRMPTPEPDTIERVYLQRTAGDVVEEIIEVPTTPPPRLQERTVVEPSGPPQVIKRVIRVPPRSGGYGAYQQQTGSFANVQQGAGGFQQFGGATAVDASYSSGFAVPAGGFQQQQQQQQNFGFGGYSPQVAAPPAGVSAANCFYV